LKFSLEKNYVAKAEYNLLFHRFAKANGNRIDSTVTQKFLIANAAYQLPSLSRDGKQGITPP